MTNAPDSDDRSSADWSYKYALRVARASNSPSMPKKNETTNAPNPKNPDKCGGCKHWRTRIAFGEGEYTMCFHQSGYGKLLWGKRPNRRRPVACIRYYSDIEIGIRQNRAADDRNAAYGALLEAERNHPYATDYIKKKKAYLAEAEMRLKEAQELADSRPVACIRESEG